MADVVNDKLASSNGNNKHAEEEEDEYEEEEYYETESDDEVVDKEIARKMSQDSQPPQQQPEGEEDDIPLGEQELPDPFSSAPLEATTKRENGNGNGNGKDEEKKKRREKTEDGDGSEKKHHRRHKRSRNMDRHVEKIEAFSKKEQQQQSSESYKSKRIHVRSKDPLKIARQIEKSLNGKQTKGVKGRPPPPQQKVNTICKVCGKEPYVVERIVAEKSWWHKNCFRCSQCNKTLNLDTYMSHEGVIYCKPHHKELFQPKVVKSDIMDLQQKGSFTQEAVARHREQERKMETIVRENLPVDLGDRVVKSSTHNEESKYQGLENLDVGSKFKMFEKGNQDDDDDDCGSEISGGRGSSRGMASSDRYGIMEKLKRLQEGEDLDSLLAEIDEELPSPVEVEDPDEIGMTAVQKKTHNTDKLFVEGNSDRREKLAAERKTELKELREKLMAGTRDAVLDQFGDLLNASANKIKKTKVDVRSENAKKFREMFDKGEVPEGGANTGGDRSIMEKEEELQQMRKTKRAQKDYFRKMEAGELEETEGRREPKLLVGKIKDVNGEINEDLPELAPLSNRFSFFEHYTEKEEERKKKKSFRMTPPREGATAEDDDGAPTDRHERRCHLSEAALARRECKARSVLNKFKEMESKVINGETEEVKAEDPDKPVMTALGFLGRLSGVGDNRRPLKRFTPPRKLGSESGSDYTGSDYSDSDEYSDSDSYTSSYTESDTEMAKDETLQAIRNTERAKKLRAKFEEWEQSQDAKDQVHQMMIQDENGSSLETASNLKAKFEALQVATAMDGSPEAKPKFRPKRFKMMGFTVSSPVTRERERMAAIYETFPYSSV